MKAEKLDHVHIFVKDLEKAKTFFADVLGTTFSDNIVDDKLYGLRASISPLGIELIEPLSPDGVVARSIEKRGEGLAGISFKVPNLEEAVKRLQSKGLTMVGKGTTGRLREAQFHPKDCFGVVIELAEYEEEHGAARAALNK